MYDVYKQEIRCFASCSILVSSVYFDTNYCTSGKAKGPCKMLNTCISKRISRGHRGRDHMVVRFTTTY